MASQIISNYSQFQVFRSYVEKNYYEETLEQMK